MAKLLKSYKFVLVSLVLLAPAGFNSMLVASDQYVPAEVIEMADSGSNSGVGGG